VSVELYRGRAQAVARTSPQTLYRPDLASFDMTGYNANDAAGFIKMFGLPLATAARRGSVATDTDLVAEPAPAPAAKPDKPAAPEPATSGKEH
jgi:hypothetical protein